MKHRDTVLVFVAIVAEALVIVATEAVRFPATGIKSMSKCIIHLVDISAQIISPVAVQTECFISVTLVAPCTVINGPLIVLISPFRGMYIKKSQSIAMTETTIIIGKCAIMTI